MNTKKKRIFTFNTELLAQQEYGSILNDPTVLAWLRGETDIDTRVTPTQISTTQLSHDEPSTVHAVGTLGHTLQERGARYGAFTEHAKIAQSMKAIMYKAPSWKECSDDKKQSLEMFADKIARILNGDPNYDDSWRDIAGYAQLIVNDLNKSN